MSPKFDLGSTLLSFLCLASPLLAEGDKTPIFVDGTADDFRAGTLEDGGHNLFVARDGSLRTINRFDLNADGRLDLIFNCTHDTYQMLPATVGFLDRQQQSRSLPLAVEGSQRAVAGDLNKDGFTDLVFCPNPIGVHHDRRFVMIAWGSPAGWQDTQINSPLPINGAAAVELADLNADGWLDIAVLGTMRWLPDQPAGHIVRIYWGSELGYTVSRFHDLGVAGARELASADFDGNGSLDLAVLGAAGVHLFWSHPAEQSWQPDLSQISLGSAASAIAAADVTRDLLPDLVLSSGNDLVLIPAGTNRRWQPPVSIPAFPATQITVADLDRDSFADIVLTQFDQARAAGGEQAGASAAATDLVRILWGDPSGYGKAQSSSLKVPYAVASAAGDLDGDGQLDLAIAIHQGAETFEGESLVYLGSGQRSFHQNDSVFPTAGTLDVIVVPAEHELPARAVFCNSIGGQLDEAVPLHVYWGQKDGFDAKKIWKIPFHSGYEATASDLNTDGYVDLMILNSGHAGVSAQTDPTLGANILWGGPEGLEQSTKRTVLPDLYLGTSSASDLNRDGYLDLILEPFAPQKPGESEKLFLYYGAADGYTAARRVVLDVEGYAQEHLVADFNQDQWLDIAVATRSLNCIRIFWGGEAGFDVQREQRLPVAGPVGVDAADLNGDGWLDLLTGNYNDPVSGYRDMGSVIFWGSSTGYSHAKAQWLPGFAPLGRTIADFDGDGYLDIFSPQQSGERTREDLACHFYWGSATGFATRRRTTLFCDSPNDSMAADFNGDGLIDLAVACHTRHGDHRAQSKIFYNDGARFAQPQVQHLPTNGPHLIWAEDVGNIYDRKYREVFSSRVFTWQAALEKGTIATKATVPEGTRLQLSIRSAPTIETLAEQPWRPVEKETFSLDSADRAMQYRAEFHSDNGDRYPILERVEITLKYAD